MPAWYEDYSDAEFFAVIDSAAYQERFRGREHPIYQSNGGPSFYNPVNLQQLVDSRQALTRGPITHNRNRYILENGLEVYKSWLRQMDWVYDQMDRNRRQRRPASE